MAAKTYSLFFFLFLSLSCLMFDPWWFAHLPNIKYTYNHTAGKEEERAMFQQMQAMAQKQVNTKTSLLQHILFDFDLIS